jgi:hypothetical protein
VPSSNIVRKLPGGQVSKTTPSRLNRENPASVALKRVIHQVDAKMTDVPLPSAEDAVRNSNRNFHQSISHLICAGQARSAARFQAFSLLTILRSQAMRGLYLT